MDQIRQDGGSTYRLGDVPNRMHILVVEDNADVLLMLCELLKILGHTFRGAQSGEEAIDLLSGADIFDVLLTDVTLPGISGIELAKIAVKRNFPIAIVFTSGYYLAPNASINFPFLTLPKPYTLSQLKEVLAKIHIRTEIPKSAV
jgi:CheY-like chemotaxis protein